MTTLAWISILIAGFGLIWNAILGTVGFFAKRSVGELDKKFTDMDNKIIDLHKKTDKKFSEVEEHLRFTDGRVDKAVDNHNEFKSEVLRMETRIVDRINNSISEALEKVKG